MSSTLGATMSIIIGRFPNLNVQDSSHRESLMMIKVK